MAQYRQIVGCVVSANTNVVLVKGNIEGPVQGVFNAPMLTGGVQDKGG
jgi:hypothetical protein